MNRLRRAAVVAILTTLPVIGFAQSTPASPKARQSTPAPTATMTGVVTSLDATSIVMTRSNAKGTAETFVVNSSTARPGKLAAGDVVSVRYFFDNGQKVASAVTVKPARKSTSASTSKSASTSTTKATSKTGK